MAFQFTLQYLTLSDIDRSSQGYGVFNWLVFINEACYDQSLLETHNRKSYMAQLGQLRVHMTK